jgi:16S rRNA (adenine1518-N6/adenine1519-N6)-dimethyltransferase
MSQVGIEPDKKHGQNFLIDLNLLDLLVEKADLQPWDVVLEVGTGMGSLTGLMAPQAAHVVTVEIDPRMHQLASEELIDHPNITLLQTDALQNKNHMSDEVLETVRQHLSVDPRRRLKLVANLPYCVATPIISNLLTVEPLPVSMTVTIQKELADRIVAEPGCKDYSALSIWIQSQCRGEIVRELAPTVFWPRPQVTSAILHLELDPLARSRVTDLAWFHDFVRQLFLYRRKFLRGVLVTVYKGQLDKPTIDSILSELGWSENIRAEELPVRSMLLLADAVKQRLTQHSQK